jgi:hypothetical protein
MQEDALPPFGSSATPHTNYSPNVSDTVAGEKTLLLFTEPLSVALCRTLNIQNFAGRWMYKKADVPP